MKNWILHTASFLFFLSGVTRAEMKSLDEAMLRDELPGFEIGNVGLVVIEKKKRLYTTGFFLSEDHFLVAEAPLAEQSIPYCEKETRIFVGKPSVALNFAGDNVPADFRCVKVIRQDVWRGYTLMEVERIGESEAAPQGLTLFDQDLVNEQEFTTGGETFKAVGFSFDQKGAQLKLATDCTYLHEKAPFTPEDLAKYKDLEKVEDVWSSLQCHYESGFQGSPILYRKRSEWFVLGTVSANVTGQGQAILAPYFPALTYYFGKKLMRRQ